MERREASTLVDEVTEAEDRVLVHPARQKSVEVLEVGVDETTEGQRLEKEFAIAEKMTISDYEDVSL